MKNLLRGYCLNREFLERLSNSRNRLYQLAYSWCHQHDIADDLVQDTMAKALKNSKQLRDHSALNSWLFGILNNCWRDHLRSKRVLDNIDDVILTSHDRPDKAFERSDLVNAVQQEMEKLNIGQRQVLSLVDLQGCSYEDVSKILQIPVGTVMSRLSRARKQLSAALLEYQPNDAKHRNSGIRRVI